jgi:hypothetical protein
MGDVILSHKYYKLTLKRRTERILPKREVCQDAHSCVGNVVLVQLLWGLQLAALVIMQ